MIRKFTGERKPSTAGGRLPCMTRTRLAVLLFSIAVASSSLAGSVETAGNPPTDVSQMVSLYQATSCRASARYTDGGGTIGGGTFVTYYLDPNIGSSPWQGPTSEQCALDTNTQVDGGPRYMQSCTWSVTMKTGYVGIAIMNLVGVDGGPNKLADGGSTTSSVRMECFNPNNP